MKLVLLLYTNKKNIKMFRHSHLKAFLLFLMLPNNLESMLWSVCYYL